MKKILITGGSGFVGRNFIEYVNLNRPGEFEIIAPSSKELDCSDSESVSKWLDGKYYDIVLYFANYSDMIDKSRDGGQILGRNLLGFELFASYSGSYGRMFFCGSGAEYDKREDIVNVTEDEIGKRIPADQYGLMKYVVGRRIEESSNIINIRIFGLFGKYEYYPTKFISGLCAKAVLGLPFTMRRNVYFDYLWIDDFIRMLLKLIDKDKPCHKTYNMVSGKKISLLELCDIVNEISGADAPVYVCNPGLAKEYTASNERFLAEFPDFEYTSMQDSIANLYSWFSEHKDEIVLEKMIY